MRKTLWLLLALVLMFSVPGALAQQAGTYTQTGRAYAPNYWTGGGTANAQTVTPVPAWSSLASNIGSWICWLPSNANTTTTPTLAVSGLTASTITKLGHTAVAANDLTTTAIACAIWDGTDFQLQNPQVVAGSGTVNNCGTGNSVAVYASSGTAVSCVTQVAVTSSNVTASIPLLGTFVMANQGTTQTSGNITLSGWGTGAAVSAVSGYNQMQQFTITAGTTPSASPTFSATFPNTFPATPICKATQVGGTGVIADITTGTPTTSATGTFTWLATPTNTQTYIMQINCGL